MSLPASLRYQPEPKPIHDVCEAIAFEYHDQLPSAVYEQLANPDLQLLETITNLIELRPREDAGGQLAIATNPHTTQEDT